MQPNREILQEGWLTKSPPIKRTLRARWRKRWFTLKQGEIPGQFCLEYYTDRNCRKLKGVIDLDQLEQVDSGLCLEQKKLKFEHMFAIKTPRRNYYLAADNESDMGDWVNCIVQVCNLHENLHGRQYYNVVPSTINAEVDQESHIASSNNAINNPTKHLKSESPKTNQGSKSNMDHIHRMPKDIQENAIVESTNELSLEDEDDNHEMPYVNTEFINKDLCDRNTQKQKNISQPLNTQPSINEKKERSSSFRQTINSRNPNTTNKVNNSTFSPNHTRSKSEQITMTLLSNNSGAVKKKIPENLVINNNTEDSIGNVEASPALSTSSGPYIPLSQCFSGSPKYCNNPTTPLNNLDPKFYETPRNSHINFGLNLTNDQSYSPKITNSINGKAKSGQTSPTDSESVFTDEDDSTYRPSRHNSDRKARPSDSSVENDLIVFSYDQRFSKFPDQNVENEVLNKFEINKLNDNRNRKQKSRLELLSENSNDKISSKDLPQFSDTENTSPAALVKNTSKWVADQRSQQYCNMNNPIAASTPNLYSENQSKTSNFTSIQSGTLPRSNPFMNSERHEENVFRYDFVAKSQTLGEENILPPVNRELKPKLNIEDKSNISTQSKSTNTLNKMTSSEILTVRPPSIDRTLKPSLKSLESPNRRSQLPTTPNIIHNSGDIQTQTLPRITTSSGHYGNNNTINNYNNNNINNNQANAIYNNNNLYLHNLSSPSSIGSQISSNLHIPVNQIQKLEYCDLEIANAPGTNRSSIISTISQQSDTKSLCKSNTVYRSIDFEKTRVLNQIREDPQGRSRRKD